MVAISLSSTGFFSGFNQQTSPTHSSPRIGRIGTSALKLHRDAAQARLAPHGGAIPLLHHLLERCDAMVTTGDPRQQKMGTLDLRHCRGIGSSNTCTLW